MSDIRIAIERKASARAITPVPRGMERKRRYVDDVALIRDHDADLFDGVTNLTLHDEPELGALGMIVAFVLLVQRRELARVSIDDIRDGAVIMHKATALIVRILLQVVKIDV